MRRFSLALFFFGLTLISVMGQYGCRSAREIKEPEQLVDRFVMESAWHRPDARVLVDANTVVAICDRLRGNLLYVTGAGGIAVVQGAGCR